MTISWIMFALALACVGLLGWGYHKAIKQVDRLLDRLMALVDQAALAQVQSSGRDEWAFLDQETGEVRPVQRRGTRTSIEDVEGAVPDGETF